MPAPAIPKTLFPAFCWDEFLFRLFAAFPWKCTDASLEFASAFCKLFEPHHPEKLTDVDKCEAFKQHIAAQVKVFLKDNEALERMKAAVTALTSFVNAYAKAVRKKAQSATQKSAAKRSVILSQVQNKVITELRVWMGNPDHETLVNVSQTMKGVGWARPGRQLWKHTGGCQPGSLPSRGLQCTLE